MLLLTFIECSIVVDSFASPFYSSAKSQTTKRAKLRTRIMSESKGSC